MQWMQLCCCKTTTCGQPCQVCAQESEGYNLHWMLKSFQSKTFICRPCEENARKDEKQFLQCLWLCLLHTLWSNASHEIYAWLASSVIYSWWINIYLSWLCFQGSPLFLEQFRSCFVPLKDGERDDRGRSKGRRPGARTNGRATNVARLATRDTIRCHRTKNRTKGL